MKGRRAPDQASPPGLLSSVRPSGRADPTPQEGGCLRRSWDCGQEREKTDSLGGSCLLGVWWCSLVVNYLLLLNRAVSPDLWLPGPNCRTPLYAASSQTCLMLLQRAPSGFHTIFDRWLTQLSEPPEHQAASSEEWTWLLCHILVSLLCICHDHRHWYENGIHECKSSAAQAAG